MPIPELTSFRIKRYLWEQRTALVGGALFLLASSLVALFPPMVVGRAVDGLTQGTAGLWRSAAAIILLACLSGLLSYGARQLLVGVSRDIEYAMRRDFFAHLLGQPPAWFQARRVGDLLTLATNDISAVRMMTGPAIMQTLNTLFVFVGTLAVMLKLSPRLTLLSLCALPLSSLTARFFGQHIHQRFQAVQEQTAALSSRIQESLSGIRVVRAYQQEAPERAAFDAQNHDLLLRNRSIIGLQAWFQPLLSGLAMAGAAAVLWVGGLEVIRGHMTLGMLVQFNLYLARLAWPMRALGWVVNQFQRAAASLDRLANEMRTAPDIAGGDLAPPAALGSLRFDDVVVDFDQRAAVLDGITLEVRRGETLGVVGPTGAGKSTLLNLVPRLRDPVRGRVLLDGQDLRRWPLAALRGRVSYVTQDSFLFSCTVAENIAFSRPSTDRDTVLSAALQAGLESDLAVLPQGLDTVLGERGVTLSGGQKQRVSLARALLRGPDILLLDDAFSAVDSHTEELILRSLRDARQGRTTVVVSHRLAAVRHSDRIAVLEAGRVLAVGPHDELLVSCALYAALWEQQRLMDAHHA